jgi:hypothetical protein
MSALFITRERPAALQKTIFSDIISNGGTPGSMAAIAPIAALSALGY